MIRTQNPPNNLTWCGSPTVTLESGLRQEPDGSYSYEKRGEMNPLKEDQEVDQFEVEDSDEELHFSTGTVQRIATPGYKGMEQLDSWKQVADEDAIHPPPIDTFIFEVEYSQSTAMLKQNTIQ